MQLICDLRTPLLFLVLFLTSCARTDSRSTRDEPPPPQPPRPATLNVDAQLTLVLPPKIAEMGPLPERLSGNLALQAREEGVPGRPDYSQYRGTISLKVTDAQGARMYVDDHTTISGEVKEPPSEAIWEVFGGIVRTMELLGRSLEGATTRPKAPR
jgi:hypothetical protein